MQDLTGTVGDGGANARHDVALVQAILVLTERPASLDARRSRYLAEIDGDCGDRTKQAIRQFQSDQVFVGPGGTSSRLVAGATAGRVAPGDVTWAKLVAAVPRQVSDLRVLRGSRTAYVAATVAQRDASLTRVGQLTFEATFRGSVVAVIRRLYDNAGIACSVCRDGSRRTFQRQYDLLRNSQGVTNAGPGESNHNFGRAVDLGFQGLRWLRANGEVVENEGWWLRELYRAQRAGGEALIFWNALREAGTQLGLHRGPVNDRPHLQAWSDADVDMADRLADLLTRSGRMRWTGRNQRYQCDLGFGGRLFDVGTAAQIWDRQAPITEAVLTQARAQVGAQPLQRGAGWPPATAPPSAGGGGAAVAAPPATAPANSRDVAAMRQALRADFEAADAAWQSWRAR